MQQHSPDSWVIEQLQDAPRLLSIMLVSQLDLVLLPYQYQSHEVGLCDYYLLTLIKSLNLDCTLSLILSALRGYPRAVTWQKLCTGFWV